MMGVRSPKNCFWGFFFYLFKWGNFYKRTTIHYLCVRVYVFPPGWRRVHATCFTYTRVYVYLCTCIRVSNGCMCAHNM